MIVALSGRLFSCKTLPKLEDDDGSHDTGSGR